MQILYIDCRGGISGDMLLRALSRLSGNEEHIYETLKRFLQSADAGCSSENANETKQADNGHGRSYGRVQRIIEDSGFSKVSKQTALRIYARIARAEATVHGATLATVHFHEVGRNEAIGNALAIGMALELIAPGKVVVSPIYDGCGTIMCSHGEISVPVPAVRALMEECDYDFRTADADTELVTPSGLAALMGIGAEPTKRSDSFANHSVASQTEAKGSRDTGQPGLRAYILEDKDG